ncbi:ankyrin repeat, PH and SEC7 domain containing protein secG-like [Gigantopelta aegis]|uniref:ankyrin repeat, PH and SEC7 domain containing protein secG-like n=1 Tax=Gigantopelta aegis TaxID=1735272 RepID=UPI001B88ACAE|nr:ankyrin repeat, PH and SEC7 domain containing protein secG-like [Gigantopelta aegis]XP_041370608.1 ankyrin repeat, PH and SEC7 domain containing protein secG-like [Gigantopelta aegis]XP_041370609.1 ankyrin repeat, PH and SEC7 domain containing protein secG-like [Gigantopelta aegis]XP_041370610.1 ankyrin repeat, PH and SEC7 domain containing protein secG-like [Gigantopelta aegis]
MTLFMNGCLCISKSRRTPEVQLTVLIRKGQLKQMKEVIRKGVDINVRNASGQTPLHISVIYSSMECVEFLLQCQDIDKNPVDCCGATPLMRASCSGNVDAVEMLVKYGCSVDFHSRFCCTTAIEYTLSSFCCVIPTIGSMDDSVTCHSVIETMKTIQKHYIHSGKYECLLLLLAAGADVNIQNKNGKTPLHQAIEEFNLEAVRILIAYNCCLDTEAIYKKPLLGLTSVTPVLLAMYLKQLPVIHLLLKSGCDVTHVWHALNSFNSEPVVHAYVCHVLLQPKTLKLLSRNRIRTCVGTPVKENVYALQLPVPVKKYIIQSIM